MITVIYVVIVTGANVRPLDRRDCRAVVITKRNRAVVITKRNHDPSPRGIMKHLLATFAHYNS